MTHNIQAVRARKAKNHVEWGVSLAPNFWSVIEVNSNNLKLLTWLFRTFRVPHYNQGFYQNLTVGMEGRNPQLCVMHLHMQALLTSDFRKNHDCNVEPWMHRTVLCICNRMLVLWEYFFFWPWCCWASVGVKGISAQGNFRARSCPFSWWAVFQWISRLQTAP